MSERLKNIFHDCVTLIGRGVEEMLNKLNTLDNVTNDEARIMGDLKAEAERFRADLDRLHSEVESGIVFETQAN